MAEEPSREKFVAVKTTLPVYPFPPAADRAVITTERLILRPLVASDIEAYHDLRRQPEVMHFTSQGRIDVDIAETQAKLDVYLPPKDCLSYNWSIRLKETDELIGVGGSHIFYAAWGWPELGYMLRVEHWGKGFATEFVKAFLEEWKKLPRVETEIRVDERTASPNADGSVPEQLIAVTEISNSRSQNILRKCGFEYFITWDAADSRSVDTLIQLPTFRFFPAKTPE